MQVNPNFHSRISTEYEMIYQYDVRDQSTLFYVLSSLFFIHFLFFILLRRAVSHIYIWAT